MWFRKKKPVDFEAKVAEYVDEQVDAMGAYHCPRCDEEHVALELAFRWPDLATVLGLATPEEPDDRIEIAGHTFVRGVLRVPVHGAKNPFQIGIWARLDDESCGRIANQVRVMAPLFDAAVAIVPGAPGLRPSFELIDHPLAKAQREGVSEAVAAEWRAKEAHFGEVEPMAPPFTATLAEHGWELLGAADTGKPACTDAIAVGHLVKVLIRLVTVDQTGQPALINAGWWLTIDDISNGRPSGTLNSVPKLPTTISTGTRMWPRPDQIYQRELAPGR